MNCVSRAPHILLGVTNLFIEILKLGSKPRHILTIKVSMLTLKLWPPTTLEDHLLHTVSSQIIWLMLAQVLLPRKCTTEHVSFYRTTIVWCFSVPPRRIPASRLQGDHANNGIGLSVVDPFSVAHILVQLDREVVFADFWSWLRECGTTSRRLCRALGKGVQAFALFLGLDRREGCCWRVLVYWFPLRRLI